MPPVIESKIMIAVPASIAPVNVKPVAPVKVMLAPALGGSEDTSFAVMVPLLVTLMVPLLVWTLSNITLPVCLILINPAALLTLASIRLTAVFKANLLVPIPLPAVNDKSLPVVNDEELLSNIEPLAALNVTLSRSALPEVPALIVPTLILPLLAVRLILLPEALSLETTSLALIVPLAVTVI